MPRLSVEDARQAQAAISYALTMLPLEAQQRTDWERVQGRLEVRLECVHRNQFVPRHQAAGRKQATDAETACPPAISAAHKRDKRDKRR